MTGVQLHHYKSAPLEGPLDLGQRVTFTATLIRRSRRANRREWSRVDGAPRVGVIVGRRTLANGKVEDPTYFVPDEHVTAYLVAYDLHRKPVHVLPADLYGPPVTITRQQAEGPPPAPPTIPGV